MAPPTVYSEASFADYLVSQFEKPASVLGWDAGSMQVMEAVNDALLDLGASNISAVTDIRGIRALGIRAMCKAIIRETSTDYNITDNGQKLEREKMNEQARKMLELAEADCAVLGVGLVGTGSPALIFSIRRTQDPYAVLPAEERTIA